MRSLTLCTVLLLASASAATAGPPDHANGGSHNGVGQCYLDDNGEWVNGWEDKSNGNGNGNGRPDKCDRDGDGIPDDADPDDDNDGEPDDLSGTV